MAHHPTPTEKRSSTSLASAFWFALILTLLLVAALNFVKIMSNNHEAHGAGHGGHEAAHTIETTSNKTLSHESSDAPAVTQPQTGAAQTSGATADSPNSNTLH